MPQKCQYHPNLGPVSKVEPPKYGTRPLVYCRFGDVHVMEDLNEISATKGSIGADVWKAELEPGDVVEWTVYGIYFSVCLEGILKGVGDIF